MSRKKAQQILKKVTLIGGLFDLILGVLKILIGQVFYSKALVVDGVHSLTDVLTDIVVVFVSHYSHEDPDQDHPYGHHRYETMATIFLGASLMVIAALIAYEEIPRLFSNTTKHVPGVWTLVIAAISVVVKEILFRVQLKVGRDYHSNMIIANAWHSRTDAISSLMVIGGLIFSYFGFPFMDQVVAVLVAIYIGKIGLDFIISSFSELVDTAVDPQMLKEFAHIIMQTDGVKGYHNLRTRKAGDKILLDINIEVADYITVSEGHEIAHWVINRLLKNFSIIMDVIVHTDIEDDRPAGVDYAAPKTERLRPLRSEILPIIQEAYSGMAEESEVSKVLLNYKNDGIYVDIFTSKTSSLRDNTDELIRKLNQYEWFKDIKIWS